MYTKFIIPRPVGRYAMIGVRRPSVCLSVRSSVRPPVCPSVCPSVGLSVRLSVRPFVCPSVCPSACPPVCPSVCPSVCLMSRTSALTRKPKRPRKTKLCIWVPQVTCDSHTDFTVKRSKVKVTGLISAAQRNVLVFRKRVR